MPITLYHLNDCRHNHLLWTDVRSQQILMADLMGDNVTVLVDSGLTVPGNVYCVILFYTLTKQLSFYWVVASLTSKMQHCI